MSKHKCNLFFFQQCNSDSCLIIENNTSRVKKNVKPDNARVMYTIKQGWVIHFP